MSDQNNILVLEFRVFKHVHVGINELVLYSCSFFKGEITISS
jgi:hypothetical protein